MYSTIYIQRNKIKLNCNAACESSWIMKSMSIPSPTKGVFTCAIHTFVFQVWLFMKVVLCTMCWCAGELLISSGTSRNTIKAETWRTRTARTITCGCLSHTHIQSLTHTHKPPDWSHRLDAPFASSLCAWPWPLTSPRMSKAQVSRSLGSRQFDIKLNSFRDQSNSLCGSG